MHPGQGHRSSLRQPDQDVADSPKAQADYPYELKGHCLGLNSSGKAECVQSICFI